MNNSVAKQERIYAESTRASFSTQFPYNFDTIEDVKLSELRDRIAQNHLDGRHIEAFLLQSAYIEAVVKFYLQIVFSDVVGDIDKINSEPFLKEMRQILQKYSFDKALSLLNKSGFLAENNFTILNDLRKRRDIILHNLLFKALNDDTFDKTLKEFYLEASAVLEVKWFTQIIHVILQVEEENMSQNKPT